MECHRIFILFLFLSLCIGINAKDVSCSISTPFMCGKDETCQQIEGTRGICKCRPGFKKSSAGNCNPLPPSQTWIRYPAEKHNGVVHSEHAPPRTPSEQEDTSGTSVSGSSIILGTIIPLALIGGAGALVYSARRYKWHERVRRLGMRRYDEVFIGRTEEEDDDAPIA